MKPVYAECKNQLPVAIVGHRGYSGQQLMQLIEMHPQMRLAGCFSRGAEKVAGHFELDQLLVKANEYHTVFLATPAEVSMELAQALFESQARVIDLSGAFRLDSKSFQTFYGVDHSAQKLLPSAVYGLQPWSKISKEIKLISNPGCYATSVLLAILPLLKDQLIDPSTLVIDAKSGATGAGRAAKENLLFCEVDGNCLPYKVGQHQHLPEIVRYVRDFAATEIDPFFTTHLLPVRRGIISAIYARVMPQISESQLLSCYNKYYENYPLLRASVISDKGANSFLSLSGVAGTARTEIGFKVNNGKLYLFSCIDNLLKGAASQAIENWNLSAGFPLTLGLMEMRGMI